MLNAMTLQAKRLIILVPLILVLMVVAFYYLFPMELFLPQVQAPTLVTWGEKDRVLHVSGAKILESSLPEATIQIMKNTGHIPMLEKPEASALAFTAFRDQVSK